MFEDILSELSKREAKYDLSGNSLRVLPSRRDGFEVSIRSINPHRYEVALEGWHESFENYDEARSCFVFALSKACRIKRLSKGNFPFRWTLEYLVDSQWREESRTGLLFYPFWVKTKIDYLQNDPVITSQ